MSNNVIADVVVSDDAQSRRWRSLFATARMAYEVGQFRDAESLLARAYEVAKELPEKEFALPSTDIGVAAVLLAEHKLKDAESRLHKALTALEGHGDALHRELFAVALRFQAQILCEKGDEKEAEAVLLRSISILKEIGWRGNAQRIFSLCDLCGLYTAQNRIDETEQHIAEAMLLMGQEFEPGSPEYVRTDMIYTVLRPMSASSRLDAVGEGIRRMEYSFGGKHPNIERALKRYIHVLEEKCDTTRLEEAKKQLEHR